MQADLNKVVTGNQTSLRGRCRDIVFACAMMLGVTTAAVSQVRPAQTTLAIDISVDGTGSYAKALPFVAAETERVCLLLEPGDQLTVRWITDRSYSSAAVVTMVSRPAAAKASRLQNPFLAAKARTAEQSQASGWQAGCAAIRELRNRPRAARTDVTGAVLAAAGSLKAAPQAVRRVMVIASDLDENVAAGRVGFDLAGVTVVLLAPESSTGSVSQLQRRVERWAGLFSSMNADTVLVVPPGMPLSLDALRGQP